MRIITLTLILLLCCTIQKIYAQDSIRIYPDTIILSVSDVRALAFSPKKDTLGFRTLTSSTSLNEYKGKENKHIMRAMRKIKASMQNNIIYHYIAGERFTKLLNYPSRSDEALVLQYPKYQITNKGVMVIGKFGSYAPWNDIMSYNITMHSYFVGFDKSVRLAQTSFVNTRPEPVGIVIVDSLIYNYPNLNLNDTIAKCIPPTFRAGQDSVKIFFEKQIRYPVIAIENGIEGRTFASFTIKPDSTLTDIKLIRGMDRSTDTALRIAIKQTADMWQPGTIDQKETPVEIVIRVRFKLIY